MLGKKMVQKGFGDLEAMRWLPEGLSIDWVIASISFHPVIEKIKISAQAHSDWSHSRQSS
jgi:hypothetical protein